MICWFALNKSTAKYLPQSLRGLSKIETLTLGDLRCLDSAFTELMKGILDGMPSLCCLEIFGNNISIEAAKMLKDIIIHHPKLVYLNLSFCEMDMNCFESILDGCKLSGSMQVLKVWMSIAGSVEGVKSLEHWLMSGKLNLLSIAFHANNNAGHFFYRLRPLLARNWEEYKSINHMRNKEIN